MYWNPVCVSTPQIQLKVKFLESLIWIMEDIVIRLLLGMEDCMQSEGELICSKFCSNWYEIRITYSNEKLILCSKIEEYDPCSNKWQEVN